MPHNMERRRRGRKGRRGKSACVQESITGLGGGRRGGGREGWVLRPSPPFPLPAICALGSPLWSIRGKEGRRKRLPPPLPRCLKPTHEHTHTFTSRERGGKSHHLSRFPIQKMNCEMDEKEAPLDPFPSFCKSLHIQREFFPMQINPRDFLFLPGEARKKEEVFFLLLSARANSGDPIFGGEGKRRRRRGNL